MPPATLMEELGAEMCVGSQVFQNPLLSMHMTFHMLICSFSINLGYSSRDLAFHFNPRFNESVIVCNSKCSDSWQTEHRDRHLSFFRGCTVKVRGLCQHGIMGYVSCVWGVCGECVVRGSPWLAHSHTIVFLVLPNTSCSFTMPPHLL